MRTFLLALLVLVLPLTALAADAAKPITLGAVGYAGAKVDKSIGELAEYLSAGLKTPVRVKVFTRYGEILQALGKKQIDVALLTPINFLRAQDQMGVQPIATPYYQSGQGNYRAMILARLDRKDITSLGDLKGKKLAFVDPHSASGYVVPRGLLAQAGLGAKDIQEVFTGNHVESVKALLAGKVDAAAVYDMLLSQNPSLGKTIDEFAVLATSDPIPSEVLAASKELGKDQVERITKLLLEFGDKRRADPKMQDCAYQWFVAYEATRFDELRKLWKSARSAGEPHR